MGIDLRRKGKIEKATEFAERIRKVQEEVEAALMKAQKEMKKQVDRGRRKAENWEVGDRVMLSMKDLVFKERLAKKLIERYVGLYEIEEVVSKNVVKLKLLATMRIYPVVNISVMRYLNTNNLYFSFFSFSDFILILFLFYFIFILDNEEVCDTAVT